MQETVRIIEIISLFLLSGVAYLALRAAIYKADRIPSRNLLWALAAIASLMAVNRFVLVTGILPQDTVLSYAGIVVSIVIVIAVSSYRKDGS